MELWTGLELFPLQFLNLRTLMYNLGTLRMVSQDRGSHEIDVLKSLAQIHQLPETAAIFVYRVADEPGTSRES